MKFLENLIEKFFAATEKTQAIILSSIATFFVVLCVVFGIIAKMATLGGIMLCIGVIIFYLASKINKKVVILFTVIICICVFFFLLITLGSSGSNEGGGCSICGKPIFSGRFCKAHFNNWASSAK